MNLVLLEAHDFLDARTARITGRRLAHVRDIHRVAVGDSLKVGLLGGQMGRAEVSQLTADCLTLSVELSQDPPPQLPLTLLLGLPRPKMLKRIFQTCATQGVRDLILINSYRVEKSYWQTPFLQPEKIREHLILGLEQGVDTQLPNVRLVKRFKPFVEDELPALAANTRAIVAHPYRATPCPGTSQQETLLAIGPEGGFIDYEVEKLTEAGLQPVTLGPRILRVEAAIPVLLGKLF